MAQDGYTKIGGVSIPKDQIASSTFAIDAQTGKKKHIIVFKNGTKVAYEGARNNQSGLLSSENIGSGPNLFNSTSAWGIMGLEIKGTDLPDNIDVKDSTVAGIDVRGGGKDSVYIRNSSHDMLGKEFLRNDKRYQGPPTGTVRSDSNDNFESANSNVHNIKY